MVNNKIRNNVAYFIQQIESAKSDKPGKKLLQKMVYLAQANGIDLGFEYGIHFYGPYSATLDDSLYSLSADSIISFEYKGYSHLMSINDEYEAEFELGETNKQKLDALIEKYKNKTPSQLELMTTTHYVQQKLAVTDEANIIVGVKKIKADKYSEEEIKEAINELNLSA